MGGVSISIMALVDPGWALPPGYVPLSTGHMPQEPSSRAPEGGREIGPCSPHAVNGCGTSSSMLAYFGWTDLPRQVAPCAVPKPQEALSRGQEGRTETDPCSTPPISGGRTSP